ncbi:MAG TPA: triose-phosphate isomerase [Oligoflexia bacterium]|nr:triose-phosphate isomerase [Oligoflexia bacterium]HMP47734.1 triose-phosphate isomerase [Oligoflexia bacterium]
MTTPVFIGNWKMNFVSKDISSFFSSFIPLLSEIYHSESNLESNDPDFSVGFAVPAPYIGLASSLTRELVDTKILIGSQNIHWAKEGAHTGEISVPMIMDLGASFSLIGHSERRSLYGETSENVAKRALFCLQSNITPVICIGETREQFENGETRSVLDEQLKLSLANIPTKDISRLIIAYEPVWAIGTGLSATPKEAEFAHENIRTFLLEKYGNISTTSHPPILYGGSVTAENARELANVKEISGFLVGGASLKPDTFLEIVKSWKWF